MNANYQRFSIIATAILLPISLIILTTYLIRSSSSDNSPEKAAESTPHPSTSPSTSAFEPFQAPDQATDRPTDPKIQPQPTRPDAPNAPNAPPPTTTQNQNLTTNPSTELSDPANPPQQTPETQPSEPKPQKHPWMARISPEQEAEIDAVIDAAEQRSREIMTHNRDRRSAIDTVNIVTEPCFEELYTRAPDITGHIILNFEIIGHPDNRGTFENILIHTNYNLHDMTFENCIITTIQSATFDSHGTDRIWVEHGIQTPELLSD